MNKKNYLMSRRENIVMQDLEDEMLVYDLTANKAFCLNETSALVWQACDGSKSIEELGRDLTNKIGSGANDELVWLALDQLKKENLLLNCDEITNNYNGLSRREIIRKVGLASMIVLPLISSIVAPTAAGAQSGGCAGLACTAPGGQGTNGCCPGFSCINQSFVLQCVACQTPGGTSACGLNIQCCSGLCDPDTGQCAP